MLHVSVCITCSLQQQLTRSNKTNADRLTADPLTGQEANHSHNFSREQISVNN